MKKGFTLLELLIVIGILAILSTTMIIVINPAEMLKKARDSQRIADLSTLKSAIAYYLTNDAAPSIGSDTYSYSVVAGTTCATRTTTSTALQLVDGTGWIPINFGALSGGSPIGSLPIDPNPTTVTPATGRARYYAYVTNVTDLTFEILANMESVYYSNGGGGDVESKDGGVAGLAYIYEMGTKLGLVTASSATCFIGDGT
ncbi:MAG: type II secretion system protein [Candidatus Paceibacterota bacterium]|jgi:type II secretory pathway pseudopilin PulG